MYFQSSGVPAAEILKRDRDSQAHLQFLELNSVDEYQLWCAQHGFSTRFPKHWKQMCRERYYVKQDAIHARLAQQKDERRHPRKKIERIIRDEIDEADLAAPRLKFIQRISASVEQEDLRAAFHQLLLHVEGRTGLLATRPALRRRSNPFGRMTIERLLAQMEPENQRGNTFVKGLLALAGQRAHWIRPLAAWQPRSHNVHHQFSSLARHLLAKYPVPGFMDSVWFEAPTDEAAQRQRWYRELGNGVSPRRLDFPIRLSKRMARHFLNAPKDFSVDAALRWGQVMGLGGSGRLVRAILGSRIGMQFDNNEFWVTVILWLIQNPTLDPAQIGPLIDYIYHQRLEGQQVVEAPHGREIRSRQPGFSMRGRRAASLVGQMRNWHARLRKQPQKPQLTWPASGIGPFELTEGSLANDNLRRWTIEELLSRDELYAEGRVLRHCVACYDNPCIFGKTSIWSLGVERNLGRHKRLVTIEVTNRTRTICQVRGKANRLASQKEMDILRNWAARERLVIGSHVASA